MLQEVQTVDGVTGQYFMSSDDGRDDSRSLSLTSVDVTDDGKYVCNISNSLGSTETSMQIVVLGKTTTRHFSVARISNTIQTLLVFFLFLGHRSVW